MMSDLLLSSLIEGKPVRLEKNGQSICVAKVDGKVMALDDTCTHADASLSEGEIIDGAIECWLHGAQFDLSTGEALTPPATTPVRIYPVKVDGDAVTVELE